MTNGVRLSELMNILRVTRPMDAEASNPKRWTSERRRKVSSVIGTLLRGLMLIPSPRRESQMAVLEELLRRHLGHTGAVFKYRYNSRGLHPQIPLDEENQRYDEACGELVRFVSSLEVEFPTLTMDQSPHVDKTPEAMKAYITNRLGVTAKTLENNLSKWKARSAGTLPWMAKLPIGNGWVVTSIEAFEKWIAEHGESIKGTNPRNAKPL